MARIIVQRNTLDVVLTCDPAISEKAQACRSAITVAGISPYQKMFILEYWVGRQGDPYVLCETILRLADKWQPRVVGVEGVAYQQALKPFLERQMESSGRWHPVILLKPDRNEKKDQRILSMQPFFRSGQVYIQRGMFELIEEYESFPNGRTRDILDALAYAIRLLVPQQQSRKPSLEIQLKELSKRDPGAARYWRMDAEKRGLIEAMPTIEDELDGDENNTESFMPGIGELCI